MNAVAACTAGLATSDAPCDAVQHSSVIMETHRVRQADVTVIVHGDSDDQVRALHGLCLTAIRQAVTAACGAASDTTGPRWNVAAPEPRQGS